MTSTLPCKSDLKGRSVHPQLAEMCKWLTVLTSQMPLMRRRKILLYTIAMSMDTDVGDSPLKPEELNVLRSQYEKEGEYVGLQTKFNYAWV